MQHAQDVALRTTSRDGERLTTYLATTALHASDMARLGECYKTLVLCRDQPHIDALIAEVVTPFVRSARLRMQMSSNSVELLSAPGLYSALWFVDTSCDATQQQQFQPVAAMTALTISHQFALRVINLCVA